MSLPRVVLTVLLTLASLARPAGAIEIWTTDGLSWRLPTFDYVAHAFAAIEGSQAQVRAIEENALPAALEAAIRTGRRPTLIASGGEQLLGLMAAGHLDSGFAEHMVDLLERTGFGPGALAMLRGPDDGLAGVPYYGWIQGIWYRRDWFEAAGLAPPDSWARLLAAAERLHDPANGRYGILLGTEQDNYAQQGFQQIALANGASLADPTSPAMTEALTFYRQLARYRPPVPGTTRARDFYLQGRVAMMIYSSFIMDRLSIASAAAEALTPAHFRELAGASYDPGLVDRTGVVTVLTARDRASYGSVSGFALLRGATADERAAAERLLRFLFRPDVQTTWMHASPGGMLPMRTGIADREAFMRDPLGVFRRFGRPQVLRLAAAFGDIKTFSLVARDRQAAVDRLLGEQRLAGTLAALAAGRIDVARATAELAGQLGGGPR